jgi:hypothetical protein
MKFASSDELMSEMRNYTEPLRFADGETAGSAFTTKGTKGHERKNRDFVFFVVVNPGPHEHLMKNQIFM